MKYVVDTNVPVVANLKSDQASPSCVKACISKIKEIIYGEAKIIVDDQWRIIKEYSHNLCSTEQQYFGNKFMKWVHDNNRNHLKCEQVTITPISSSDPNEFQEFPSDPRFSSFDPSDRKFIAVALSHNSNPPILQAVDRKWWNYREIFKQNNVNIEFLCVQDCQDREG